MTELRRRMVRDMTLRGFSPLTHEAYLEAVSRLAVHYRRSPDQLSSDEVQAYLAHMLQVRGLSWSTCSIAANAFKFLFHVTLGHDKTDFRVPSPRQSQKLPEILSREEVAQILEAPRSPKHRLLLATMYAGGLRVSETVALKVSDVDRDRMTLRIDQGKGRKDRYVPPSHMGTIPIHSTSTRTRASGRSADATHAHQRHPEGVDREQASSGHQEAWWGPRSAARFCHAPPGVGSGSPCRPTPAGPRLRHEHDALLPLEPDADGQGALSIGSAGHTVKLEGDPGDLLPGRRASSPTRSG